MEDFFILSTGLAAEIIQKFILYNLSYINRKVVIIGDFSHYTSKPLKDFIFESKHGKDIFFVETEEEAIRRLVAVEHQICIGKIAFASISVQK